MDRSVEGSQGRLPTREDFTGIEVQGPQDGEYSLLSGHVIEILQSLCGEMKMRQKQKRKGENGEEVWLSNRVSLKDLLNRNFLSIEAADGGSVILDDVAMAAVEKALNFIEQLKTYGWRFFWVDANHSEVNAAMPYNGMLPLLSPAGREKLSEYQIPTLMGMQEEFAQVCGHVESARQNLVKFFMRLISGSEVLPEGPTPTEIDLSELEIQKLDAPALKKLFSIMDRLDKNLDKINFQLNAWIALADQLRSMSDVAESNIRREEQTDLEKRAIFVQRKFKVIRENISAMKRELGFIENLSGQIAGILQKGLDTEEAQAVHEKITGGDQASQEGTKLSLVKQSISELEEKLPVLKAA